MLVQTNASATTMSDRGFWTSERERSIFARPKILSILCHFLLRKIQLPMAAHTVHARAPQAITNSAGSTWWELLRKSFVIPLAVRLSGEQRKTFAYTVLG